VSFPKSFLHCFKHYYVCLSDTFWRQIRAENFEKYMAPLCIWLPVADFVEK
jgi:hypothetical protein